MLPVVIFDGVLLIWEYLSPFYIFLIVQIRPDSEIVTPLSESANVYSWFFLYIFSSKLHRKFWTPFKSFKLNYFSCFRFFWNILLDRRIFTLQKISKYHWKTSNMWAHCHTWCTWEIAHSWRGLMKRGSNEIVLMNLFKYWRSQIYSLVLNSRHNFFINVNL